MNSKKFEYVSKDNPFLKRDICFRSIFLVLFLAVFVWQFALMIVKAIKKQLTTPMLIAGMFICFVCLLFVLICLLYMLKALTAIRNIKAHGKFVTSANILVSTKKGSLITMYSTITKLLAIILALVLVSIATYTVLQIVYLSSYSYYMPLMYLVAICGFNSVYHITYEIATIKNVQEYNNMI